MERYKKCWASSIAYVFGIMTGFSECAILEKPEWMSNRSTLKRTACEVVKIVPQVNEAWFMRGKVYQDAGERRKAMECYEKGASLCKTEGVREEFREWKQKALKSRGRNN